MREFTSEQNYDSSKGKMSSIESYMPKYIRAVRIVKLLILCVVVVLIASLFFNIDKYIYKSVPVNYVRLSENSVGDSLYYIDSISYCSEAFDIVRSDTYNGVSFNSSVSTYYLAADKNGFIFFIETNSETKDHLLKSMEAGVQELVLYGELTTLPTNIDATPQINALTQIDPEDIMHSIDSITKENEELISQVKQYKMLKIYKNPPKTLTVEDGVNPSYTILKNVRWSLAIMLIVLFVLKKKYTAKLDEFIDSMKIINI